MKNNMVLKYDGKYRQFDLKCMLNLASVKAGDKKLSYNGEQVSLTQLDSLPLDIQLQVANDDSADFFLASTSSRPNNCNIRSKKTTEIFYVDDDNENADIESSQACFTTSIRKDNRFDDILVLNQFMDDHQCPSDVDVQMVIDYLHICVSEKRLDDTVTFLRLIRNRSDTWGQTYETFLKSVEMEIFSKQRRRLDIIGLGL